MAHIERSRAIVEASETFDGDILPAKQDELERPVKLRSESTIRGSVYGQSIEVDADATVRGSVMGGNSVAVDGCHIQGEVGTPGKVVGEDSRIDGTVTGKRVRLTNCVVRGNVVGDNVIIEDCIVLGLVSGERKVTIDGSLCYTFQSGGETELAEATLVLPQAKATESITFETPVSVAGLGKINTEDGESSKLPEMTAEDVYTQNDTVYLTLANRILNLEKVTDRLDELEHAIMTTVDDSSDGDGTEMSIDDVLELLEVDLNAEDILRSN